ncbi:MAG TPA: DUF4019 domain-containing protein [Longimicrobiales bacterium]
MTDHAEAETAALSAADRWLALVDRGDLHASWSEASALFRAMVGEGEWEASLARAQAPIGRPLAREIRSMRYATSLPGAPDGEYVVLEYETRFERKERGGERVVMMKERDGEWRAAGYFVS